MRLLTCVQSQERDHAFFSLGLRTRTATYAAVRAEYDDCAFLRTHILRPTWHFVLPEDLRWILAATSERVIRGMAYRHAQVGLADPRHVERSLETLVGLLSGRTFLTRQEIGARFDEHDGLPRKGEQLGHLLLLAELRGLICSGRSRACTTPTPSSTRSSPRPRCSSARRAWPGSPTGSSRVTARRRSRTSPAGRA